MSGFRKAVAAVCLGVALLPFVAQAKVLVVSDITTAGSYTGANTDIRLANVRMLAAVQRILTDYGASYRVLSPTVAKTEFCRTGVVTHLFGTAGAYTESFDAVIHVGFNGTGGSTFTGYRPDSLTLTAAAPTVPQLMLLDDILPNDGNVSTFDNAAGDSTWVASTGYQVSGGGSGNHEGEGCVYDANTGVFRWFDIIFGGTVLKKSGSPTGGMRVLLAAGANAVMTNLELTGNMPTFPESLSTANTDTMKVWEKLNSHKFGASRIVFATCGAALNADSANAAIPSTLFNTYSAQGINWPVLLYSIGHLDSLASGNVLGGNKTLKWGAVIHSVGNTSDRRHPGGLFRADTSIAAASGDSTRRLGIKVVLAASPESLRVNEGPAIWKNFGSVRWTPFVRFGLDTLALPADGSASYLRPVDVFGRYRNRIILGDLSATGKDSSLWALLKGARDTLAKITGGEISGTIVPPDDDWSPYQMRAHQNANQLDSIQTTLALLGFSHILTNTQNRDRDPAYLRTNPKGWLDGQKRHSMGGRGSLSIIGYTVNPGRGSQYAGNGDALSFGFSPGDSLPPIAGGVRSIAVDIENSFWNGFFGPSRDYTFWPYDNVAINAAPLGVPGNYLYPNNKASVIYLPAQSFGGQSSTTPNRWGYFVLKHLQMASKAINGGAWRTIISNAFPEEIEP